MEKFKRKLTLLNIPVLEIDNLKELDEVLFSFATKKALSLDQMALAGLNNDTEFIKAESEVPTLEALIGVEESSILFVASEIAKKCIKSHGHQYFSIVLRERNIVENIEVALYKINNGSNFYGKVLEVLEPNDIPKNCIIVVSKS